MIASFMELKTRRTLYARSLATVADAALSAAGRSHPDAQLLDACARFNAVEQRKIQVLRTGCADDPRIGMRVARLCMEQAEHVTAMCESRATTGHGHRARALSFSLWDEGNLAYRAAGGDGVEERLLHALLRDLTRGLRPVRP